MFTAGGARHWVYAMGGLLLPGLMGLLVLFYVGWCGGGDGNTGNVMIGGGMLPIVGLM